MHKYAALTALVIALITMLTLAVSASLTPANAIGGDGCPMARIIGVRAGTPGKAFSLHRGICSRSSWEQKPLAIIEGPHNGTAVLRADGSIYYSPKPGFIGQDPMTVRFSLLGGPVSSSLPRLTTGASTYTSTLIFWVY
jgi:hypothetical protein